MPGLLGIALSGAGPSAVALATGRLRRNRKGHRALLRKTRSRADGAASGSRAGRPYLNAEIRSQKYVHRRKRKHPGSRPGKLPGGRTPAHKHSSYFTCVERASRSREVCRSSLCHFQNITPSTAIGPKMHTIDAKTTTPKRRILTTSPVIGSLLTSWNKPCGPRHVKRLKFQHWQQVLRLQPQILGSSALQLRTPAHGSGGLARCVPCGRNLGSLLSPSVRHGTAIQATSLDGANTQPVTSDSVNQRNVQRACGPPSPSTTRSPLRRARRDDPNPRMRYYTLTERGILLGRAHVIYSLSLMGLLER